MYITHLQQGRVDMVPVIRIGEEVRVIDVLTIVGWRDGTPTDTIARLGHNHPIAQLQEGQPLRSQDREQQRRRVLPKRRGQESGLGLHILEQLARYGRERLGSRRFDREPGCHHHAMHKVRPSLFALWLLAVQERLLRSV